MNEIYTEGFSSSAPMCFSSADDLAKLTGSKSYEGRLLRIENAAEYLGISVGTLYVWVHQGKIPHIKMGRLLKFDKLQLDLFIERNQVKAKVDLSGEAIQETTEK